MIEEILFVKKFDCTFAAGVVPWMRLSLADIQENELHTSNASRTAVGTVIELSTRVIKNQ